MRALLALASLLLLLVLVGPATGQTPDPLLAPTSVCRVGSPTQMLCLHNFARKQSGLMPLKATPELYASAGRKADRIIECGIGPEDWGQPGVDPHRPCGDPFLVPPGFDSFGENLAYGYPTIRATFSGWLKSPGHRANILTESHRLYGSAYRASYPRLWVTQFGRLAASPVAP